MKGEKAHKGKKILLRLALIAFLGYGVISFVLLQADLSQKDQELKAIQEKIAAQKQTNNELETLLEEENYSEYVARIAREKYGYTYPDERAFVDVSGQ